MNNEEKVFVAGSNGMVGSAICRTLIEDGYSKNSRKKSLLIPNRSELNLLNNAQVNNWFKENKPTIVIIAAAKVGGILANSKYPADFLLQNLKIQTNIIEAAWVNKVKRLLFLGSSCIYPKNSKQPIPEDELLQSSLESTNESYAIAKIAGIKLCQSLRTQYGFDAISLMPTNLYGPGDNYHEENSHVLPALIRRFHNAKVNKEKIVTCWGTGKPLREFLYVDDLADACLFALNNWHPLSLENPYDTKNQIQSWLNVGSKYEISIKELANKIASHIGYQGEIRWDHTKPDGTLRKKLDTSKINNLGWYPKTDFDTGIKNTIKVFQNELNLNLLRS